MKKPREHSLAQLLRLMRDLDSGKLDEQLLNSQPPAVEAPFRSFSSDLEQFDVAEWVRRVNAKLPE